MTTSPSFSNSKTGSLDRQSITFASREIGIHHHDNTRLYLGDEIETATESYIIKREILVKISTCIDSVATTLTFMDPVGQLRQQTYSSVETCPFVIRKRFLQNHIAIRDQVDRWHVIGDRILYKNRQVPLLHKDRWQKGYILSYHGTSETIVDPFEDLFSVISDHGKIFQLPFRDIILNLTQGEITAEKQWRARSQ